MTRFWQPGMGLPPSVRDTSPVGVPAPGAAAVTSTVMTSGCPGTRLVGFGLTETVGPSWLTVWVKTADVLELKTASPLYTAVMESPPTRRDEISMEAAVVPFDVLRDWVPIA